MLFVRKSGLLPYARITRPDGKTFEIQDRTAKATEYSFGGFYVVFEIRPAPFPHRDYCGHFADLRDAKARAESVASLS